MKVVSSSLTVTGYRTRVSTHFCLAGKLDRKPVNSCANERQKGREMIEEVANNLGNKKFIKPAASKVAEVSKVSLRAPYFSFPGRETINSWWEII